jgi:hypothetical protein
MEYPADCARVLKPFQFVLPINKTSHQWHQRILSGVRLIYVFPELLDIFKNQE